VNEDRLRAKAQLLRSLHDDPPLLLPNAWDAASAVLIATEGARATGRPVRGSPGRRAVATASDCHAKR